MMKLNHIEVGGYRRLVNVGLEIRPLTVLIGPNGAGKTSVMECLWLLAQSARGQLSSAFGDLGGITAVLTSGRGAGLRLGATMAGCANPLYYTVEIGPQGVAYEISTESLTEKRDMGAAEPFKHVDSNRGRVRYYSPESSRLVSPTWEYEPRETALSQVPKLFRDPEAFRSHLSSLAMYGALDVTTRSPVRLPQPMQPAPLPGTKGETLVSCLYYLRETAAERFSQIEDTLAAGFSGFERLSFPPVAAGTLALTWKDRHFSQPMYVNQLSEGTLRFLWLATLLQCPSLPAVVLIDEPELSLHPALLSLLADLLREASQRTQIIVATQSDRLVRFLKPGELLVCDLDDNGESSFVWADTMDLENWLTDYTLDELVTMNILGGRP